MRQIEGYELLDSVAVEMDPIADGFGGVLVELVKTGGLYVLTETASVTGNRLLGFSSSSEELVRALFDNELGRGEGRPSA
jgi:hypothetical protein